MTPTLSPAGNRTSAIPASPARPEKPLRILAAITEQEMQNFFGTRSSLPERIVLHTTRKGDWQERLEEMQPEVMISCWTTPALPSAWIDRPSCPLKYVCHLTGSVRGVVPRRFIERGGLVTNWGGLAAPQVAEHALLLALAALRNLPEWRPSHWDCKFTTKTLFGKTVGLHGFGQVARSLRELLRPFHVRVCAYSEGVPTSTMAAHGVESCPSLTSLFSRSDVLIECEALNALSAGSVTADILAALPDGAVFVNVGRGLVVDETALIREAVSRRIAIALDVVSVEPLPASSPLATLPNVIYSPHLAGPTGDQFLCCGSLALDNLSRYECNLPLEALVTLDIYDRAT